MKKTIDCVLMTREIRDEITLQHKDLNLVDFAKSISEEAKKTKLWKNRSF